MKFNRINILKRLLTKHRQEPFLSFKRILGFSPRNIDLFKLAVRHRSSPFKNAAGEWVNNERLEFLGDSVLNTIVSDVLYHDYSSENEGFLTNARSNIVKRESLNKICRQIGLDKLVVADKMINLDENTSIYGNVLEAFIGAVYLDAGYKKCTQFVKKKILLSPECMQSLAEENGNYKSELLEWCQQRYFSLEYELMEETVDSFNRHTFVSLVKIQNTPMCTGNGASKKESHQQASFQTLEMIKNKDALIGQLIADVN